MLSILDALNTAAKTRASGRSAAIPDDPIEWVHSQGEHLWSKQREIVEALDHYRAKVAVPTCNGAGKTHLASRLAIHFALKHQNENARVVIVGPSWTQLEEGTLDHAKQSDAISPPGTLRPSRAWFEINGRHMIVWRSPPKGQTARNILQGYHSRKMLIILEEAGEIGYRLWTEATGAITSGGDARILAIGNPLDTGTPFHAACQPRSGWSVIQIGYKDTPNFTGEKVPQELREVLPNEDWVKEKRAEWSKALFRGRAEGLFPEKSEWALIEPEWIENAMKDTDQKQTRRRSPAMFSVDPGSGGDPTVACYNKQVHGQPEFEVLRFLNMGDYEHSRDREATATHIGLAAKKHRAVSCVIDTFGVGGDFAAPIARASMRTNVLSLNSGDKQKLKRSQKRLYYDPRAVCAWRFAERLRHGTLFLPDNPEFARQISELRQVPETSGLRRLETKADMMERIGRSPDLVDAAMMSQWLRRLQVDVIVGHAGAGI